MGTLTYLGSNYVIVQLGENRSVRKWLDAVEKIEEAEATVNSRVEPKVNITKAMKQRSKYK